MKFATFAPAALAFVIPTFAQVMTVSLTYDNTYDNASVPLTEVACSNGANGLITKGYTTLGSLPTSPNLGGAYTVTGWNSPACGTCYQINYTIAGTTNSIYALAVDVALNGFNLAEAAMNTLTDGLAYELGHVEVTSIEVDATHCGMSY